MLTYGSDDTGEGDVTVRIIRGAGRYACPEDYWALYDDADFNEGNRSGEILISDQSIADLQDHGFNDRASSIVNHTRYYVGCFDHADYGGREIGLDPGQGLAGVRMSGSRGAGLLDDCPIEDLNDAVSSVRLEEPAPQLASLTAGIYTLANVNSGKALDVVNAASASGANVQQYQPNGSKAQLWRINPLGDGVHIVISANSGKALDVSGAGTHNGANVQQWEANGSNAQKWLIHRLASGSHTLTNVNSGKVLDVDNASTANHANVQQWESNQTDAQKWLLNRVG